MIKSSSPVPGRQVAFDAFRLDFARHRLWRGEQEIPLRPKSWDLLCYLLGQPGLLVAKEILHREIWPDTAVSDDALTKVVAELRQTLGDNPRAPRLIETVHGRGFRFVADIRDVGPETGVATSPPTDAARHGEAAPTFVGRQLELGRLHECLDRAAQGARQLVFITGEAGIGKTTLSEEFLRSAASRDPDIYILHGQCIQQYGQREPYMPVLEALERLLSSSRGAALIPGFRRVAPCWYVQIPWLLSEGEPSDFQRAMMNTAPQRMLREIGAFLESMAAQSTVVFVLEDLHWSDHATTDLLSFLAERRDPARLVLIGTYRPAEASARDHPIREVNRTLRSHRRCVDLRLDYLSAANVREYLRRRFGDQAQDLAQVVHERTDGNPLFVVAIVEELIRRGHLKATDRGWVVNVATDRVDLVVPNDLLDMFAAQFHRLTDDERAVLEVASVAGVSFAPWMVARALGRDVDDVEAVAQGLVKSHLFLNVSSHVEDGLARRYGFGHALHRQMIYEQIPDGRRGRLHQMIGEALESSSGDRLVEIAPELSVHFEQSGDHARAIKYLRLCITLAQQRFAHQEAVAHGTKALGLLGRVSESPLRDRLELEVRLLLGVSLNVTRSYGSPEVRENFDRAGKLCADSGDARQLFEIVHAVWYAQMAASELDGARGSLDELTRIAERHPAAEFRLRAELARGRTEFWMGNFGAAAKLLTHFLEEFAKQPIASRAEMYGVEPAVAGFMQGGLALWFLGRPDRARALARRGLAYAEENRNPFSLASALVHAMILELLCRDATAAAALAPRAAEVSAANSIAQFRAFSRFFRGAALAEQGDVGAGLSEMVPGLAEHRSLIGPHVTGLMLGFIATAHGRARQWDEGLRRVEEGITLTETTSECMYASGLWRVKGELLLGKSRESVGKKAATAGRAVEVVRLCFQRALEIAQGQEARSLALQSAMSLARLPGPHGVAPAARARLRSLYASFTEGFDTPDLKDAQALLKELKT
jgi:DNA-binding winged helix-turn-helix (wHTH) protein/tetratricopeptide (TPR) repeat protein